MRVTKPAPALERVVDSLYRKALTGDVGVGACCFWLKNRRPSELRDVAETEQTNNVVQPLSDDSETDTLSS